MVVAARVVDARDELRGELRALQSKERLARGIRIAAEPNRDLTQIRAEIAEVESDLRDLPNAPGEEVPQCH